MVNPSAVVDTVTTVDPFRDKDPVQVHVVLLVAVGKSGPSEVASYLGWSSLGSEGTGSTTDRDILPRSLCGPVRVP